VCVTTACNNGGGQLRSESADGARDVLAAVEGVYRSLPIRDPQCIDAVRELYNRWLEGPDSDKTARLLHTQYHAVERTIVSALKW
jgi:iron only hydrogenase large subunit-like protein